MAPTPLNSTLINSTYNEKAPASQARPYTSQDLMIKIQWCTIAFLSLLCVILICERIHHGRHHGKRITKLKAELKAALPPPIVLPKYDYNKKKILLDCGPHNNPPKAGASNESSGQNDDIIRQVPPHGQDLERTGRPEPGETFRPLATRPAVVPYDERPVPAHILERHQAAEREYAIQASFNHHPGTALGRPGFDDGSPDDCCDGRIPEMPIKAAKLRGDV